MANRVLSRDQLMERMHGREAGPYDRSIDVQIGRLRRKIEKDPAKPELIKSVRGAGYLFAARVVR
jgi:DNA-binding response OmpR family regulator